MFTSFLHNLYNAFKKFFSMEECNLDCREVRLKKIPLLVLGILGAPLLSPEISNALNVLRWNYSPISRENAKKIVSSPSWPDEYKLKFIIPKNKDPFGESLDGSFLVERKSDLSSLEVRINHPNDHKFFQSKKFSRGGSQFYYERLDDFDNSTSLKYEGEYQTSDKTIIDVVHSLIDGNTGKKSFVFYGADREKTSYVAESQKRDVGEYDFEIHGEIKKGDPLFNNFRIFYYSFENKFVPVEIRVQYKVKISKIPFPVDLEVRGVLEV